MTQSNEKAFIKWLNYEIGMAISLEDGHRAHALVQAKEKFLFLTQQTQNP